MSFKITSNWDPNIRKIIEVWEELDKKTNKKVKNAENKSITETYSDPPRKDPLLIINANYNPELKESLEIFWKITENIKKK